VFVIGGMTDPEGHASASARYWLATIPDRLGASCARRRTGRALSLRDVSAPDSHTRLQSSSASASMRSRRRQCPFDPPIVKGPERLAHWVKPVLVCEATYTEWTNDKRLRHPVFVKIRKDVKPKEITPPRWGCRAISTSSLSPRQVRVPVEHQTVGSLRR
jgi:bifunctional non-homologous end joining protein LigD